VFGKIFVDYETHACSILRCGTCGVDVSVIGVREKKVGIVGVEFGFSKYEEV
jgi:hypothetical protein